MRNGQEPSRFLNHILEIDQPATFTNDVKQIAMFACSGVRPFARRAFGGILQTNEHRAARHVSNVTHQPVIALTTTVRKIVAAHGLGSIGETAR
ncbi:hypothetical protein G6N74_29835 [Mesorhizobium sp. CGMCC 1.15528]|uniref:Uncharacterized protein n=1 Tax=Mesorhizobium zhangyense TaxID=1776730 RepID=A0A7C9RC13_9HYPH|nr:hypothetical protein [Mesorhizobium zhangyense]